MLKEDIMTLVILQNIEAEDARIQALLDDIPRKMEALDAELATFEQKITEGETALAALQKSYRELDRESRALIDSVRKNRDRLNTVKSNKEYQALLKGIEETELKVSAIEDRMLGILDDIEQAGTEVARCKTTAGQIQERITADRDKILREAEEAEKRRSRLEEERRDTAADVSPGFMEKYNGVKRQCGAPAVVAIRNGACEGCNMRIPPQMCIIIRQYEFLNFCPFCHKIIYWDADE